MDWVRKITYMMLPREEGGIMFRGTNSSGGIRKPSFTIMLRKKNKKRARFLPFQEIGFKSVK